MDIESRTSEPGGVQKPHFQQQQVGYGSSRMAFQRSWSSNERGNAALKNYFIPPKGSRPKRFSICGGTDEHLDMCYAGDRIDSSILARFSEHGHVGRDRKSRLSTDLADEQQRRPPIQSEIGASPLETLHRNAALIPRPPAHPRPCNQDRHQAYLRQESLPRMSTDSSLKADTYRRVSVPGGAVSTPPPMPPRAVIIKTGYEAPMAAFGTSARGMASPMSRKSSNCNRRAWPNGTLTGSLGGVAPVGSAGDSGLPAANRSRRFSLAVTEETAEATSKDDGRLDAQKSMDSRSYLKHADSNLLTQLDEILSESSKRAKETFRYLALAAPHGGPTTSEATDRDTKPTLRQLQMELRGEASPRNLAYTFSAWL